MIHPNHLRYAVNMIQQYDGSIPLAAWLKDFFRANKQMGSRDRKSVANLVYGYFRLGHLGSDNIAERILAASTGDLSSFDGQIFPWTDLLSDAVDAVAFSKSFLVQPDLFIRVRPGYDHQVRQKLDAVRVPYESCGESCLRLPNSFAADAVLELNREAVIQDMSSQQTGTLIPRELTQHPAPAVWDCCAASGGKSIMAFDVMPKMILTVSDIRSSIISNLRRRFSEAGIKRYSPFVADLTTSKSIPGPFDMVIADAPCSGSGTWARTPEQLYFFKPSTIEKYQRLQTAILRNVRSSLRAGGYILYITCSVFKAENEDVVHYAVNSLGLEVESSRFFKGYDKRADTLFAALLRAPSA